MKNLWEEDSKRHILIEGLKKKGGGGKGREQKSPPNARNQKRQENELPVMKYCMLGRDKVTH